VAGVVAAVTAAVAMGAVAVVAVVTAAAVVAAIANLAGNPIFSPLESPWREKRHGVPEHKAITNCVSELD
jgi:hypothetical protein